MEENERTRRILTDLAIEAQEDVAREISRRNTWIDEEKERRRRILEDFASDFQVRRL
jgi:hypothetical protein